MTAQNPFLLEVQINLGDKIKLTFRAPTKAQKDRARTLLAEYGKINQEVSCTEVGEQISEALKNRSDAFHSDIEGLNVEMLIAADIEGEDLPDNWKECVRDAGHLQYADGIQILTAVCFHRWAGSGDEGVEGSVG